MRQGSRTLGSRSGWRRRVAVVAAIAIVGPAAALASNGGPPPGQRDISDGKGRAASGDLSRFPLVGGRGKAELDRNAHESDPASVLGGGRSSASRSDLAGLPTAAAVVERTFGARLDANWFDPEALAGGEVVKLLSDHTARIKRPGGKLGVVDSSSPLRTPSGDLIDLSLRDVGNGFAAARPVVPVGLPATLADTFSVGGVRFRVEDTSGRGVLVAGRRVHYAGSSVLATATPGGVEVFSLIASRKDRMSQTLRFTGTQVKLAGDGASVLRDGAQVAAVRPPSAIDAAGRSVRVTIEQAGTDGLRVTAHPTAETTTPILLDPVVDSTGSNWFQNGSTAGLADWLTVSQSSGTAFAFRQTGYAPEVSCYPGPKDVAANCRPGQYIYAYNGGSYPINSFAEYVYVPPGSSSYVTQANMLHLYFQHHNDLDDSPFMFVGIWKGGTPGQQWRALQSFTWDVSDHSHTLSAGADTDGESVAFGVVSLYSNTLTAWRDAYLGGATVTMDDPDNPTVQAPPQHSNAAATGWVDSGSDTATVTATDSGLGVKTMTFGGSYSFSQRTHSCGGGAGSPCPASWSQDQTYPFAQMPEGTTTATATATDAPGRPSNTMAWSYRVDHSNPSASEVGEGWTGVGGKIGPGLHAVSVVANDTYSGVASIALKIDGTPVETSSNGSCSGENGGCGTSYNHTFTYDADDYSPGPHVLTVTTTDDVDRQTTHNSGTLTFTTTPSVVDPIIGQASCIQSQMTDPDPTRGDAVCQAIGTVTFRVFGLPNANPWSDTCVSPQARTVFDGYAGSTYAKLIADPAATAQASSVCFRINKDAGAGPGGRLDVPVASGAGQPTVDPDYGACLDNQATNTLPGFHPLFAYGPDPDTGWSYLLDAYADGSSDVWLCLRADPVVGSRVKISQPSTNGTPVVHRDDPQRGPDAETPGRAGYPSSTCQNATSGRTRAINANVGGARVWLYAWQEPGKVHLCVRGENGSQGYGGRITVDATGAPGVTPVGPSPDTDTTGCVMRPLTVAGVTVNVGNTPAGTNPAKVCVTSAALPMPVILTAGFSGSPHAGHATWTPDPGTPIPPVGT